MYFACCARGFFSSLFLSFPHPIFVLAFVSLPCVFRFCFTERVERGGWTRFLCFEGALCKNGSSSFIPFLFSPPVSKLIITHTERRFYTQGQETRGGSTETKRERRRVGRERAAARPISNAPPAPTPSSSPPFLPSPPRQRRAAAHPLRRRRHVRPARGRDGARGRAVPRFQAGRRPEDVEPGRRHGGAHEQGAAPPAAGVGVPAARRGPDVGRVGRVSSHRGRVSVGKQGECKARVRATPACAAAWALAVWGAARHKKGEWIECAANPHYFTLFLAPSFNTMATVILRSSTGSVAARATKASCDGGDEGGRGVRASRGAGQASLVNRHLRPPKPRRPPHCPPSDASGPLQARTRLPCTFARDGQSAAGAARPPKAPFILKAAPAGLPRSPLPARRLSGWRPLAPAGAPRMQNLAWP